MLFFLAAAFYILLSSMYDNERLLSYCVKFAPQLPQGYLRSGNWQAYFVWLMLGSSIWLLFLLWNLLYLALATGIMFALFTIVAYRLGKMLAKSRKPFQRINIHEVED
jgi:hypothetical protein